jgi:hypothetical protein
LTLEGLKKLLEIKKYLNLGFSDELKTKFTNIRTIEIPLVAQPKIIDPNCISSFTIGEGCFQVRFKISTNSKLGVQVSLFFKITQLERDKELMKSFIDYFNWGSISKNSTCIDYTVVKQEDLVLKIIPFFDKYKIVGVKLQDHLTTSKLKKIKEIKEGMNKGR